MISLFISITGILLGGRTVSTPFRELKEEPPSPGPWAGRSSYYRIDLKGYQQFPNSVPLKDFIEKNRVAIQDELRGDATQALPLHLIWRKRRSATRPRCLSHPLQSQAL